MTRSKSNGRSKRGLGPKTRIKNHQKELEKKYAAQIRRAERLKEKHLASMRDRDLNNDQVSIFDNVDSERPVPVRNRAQVSDDCGLDLTKPEQEDDGDIIDLDLADDENNEISQVSELDDLNNLDDLDLDLDAPDDDLDLDAPYVLASRPDKTSAIDRLAKAMRDKGMKANRSKAGSGQKALRSKDQKGYVALPTCNTVEKIHAWWKDTFDTFETKCLRATGRKKALDLYRTALNAIIAGEVFTSTPMLTMRVVCELGRKHLHDGMLRAVEGDSAIRIYLITIIAGQGLTSHANTDIDLSEGLAREQAFLRDVSRNYFAVHELALFNSHGHPDGGQMLQRHTHAIVMLAEGDPDPQVAIDKHLKNFEPNFTGIPVIDVRPVETDAMNLARVAAYMFKAPSRCKSWREGKEGKRGFINNSEAGDRSLRYLRMAQIRSMLSLEDATFAGGLGAEIRSGLIKTARAQCAAEAPPASRLLHPDAIGSFWTDVMRALNRKTWNLPVIRTRK
jgi:hypothetical protein